MLRFNSFAGSMFAYAQNFSPICTEGQIEYTTPGTYSWVAPDNVYKIS